MNILQGAVLACAMAGVGAAGYWCCTLSPTRGSIAVAASPSTQVATLEVSGMTCGGCAVSVKTALKAVDGVKKVKVSFKEKKAVVEFDPTQTDAQTLAAAVTKAGFPAQLESDSDGEKPESEGDG